MPNAVLPVAGIPVDPPPSTADDEAMGPKASYRLAAENAEMRQKFVAAAEKIIEAEGVSALTAGRLAKQFDLKRTTVHYYFGTIDDIIIDVITSRSRYLHDVIDDALSKNDPLSVLFKLGSTASSMSIEMSALAMRRPKILKEVHKQTGEFKVKFVKALKQFIDAEGLSPPLSPEVIVTIIQDLSHGVSLRHELGIEDADNEAEKASRFIIDTIVGIKRA